jgi:hypothetical protein
MITDAHLRIADFPMFTAGLVPGALGEYQLDADPCCPCRGRA